jgi:hypothetical protein
VTGNQPREEGLGWARELGVGVILVKPPSVQFVLAPVVWDPHPAILRRVQAAIATRAVLA